jgi:hypothetical protein
VKPWPIEALIVSPINQSWPYRSCFHAREGLLPCAIPESGKSYF